MATQRNNDDRSQARREAAALLGVDIDRLSPADGLRVDMVSALRLVIDAEQGAVLSGNQADLGKLNVAVQSLIALLPGRELPESQRDDRDDRDDREAMIAPLLKLYRYLHEQVHTLTAENAQLRARLGLSVSTAVTPREADVCPPGEWRGETYAGVRPGPDDPKPGPLIEGVAVRKPPAAKATHASSPSWDDSDSGRLWRQWHDAGGSVGGDRWSNRNIP